MGPGEGVEHTARECRKRCRGYSPKRNYAKALESGASADTCANYLLKHNGGMAYHKYLDAGYPIATGVIEGACRHLIKDRMDVTGARWCLNGAEAILKLRSLRSSGDFESYFEYHKQQELRRNHISRYQNLQLEHAA